MTPAARGPGRAGGWRLLALVRACLLGLALVLPGGAGTAQTAPAEPPAAPPPAVPAATTADGEVPGLPADGPDYAVWEALAARTEDAMSRDSTSSDYLELVRSEIVGWRQQFLAAQGINAARISTLREQIDALGPAPAEGTTEAPEIAQRRSDLADQLNLLQAPGITAGVAYSRADGLIREIDSILRDRQADELLQLWPVPVNPVNWPAAFAALLENWATVRNEVHAARVRPEVIEALRDRLPAIAGLFLIGLLLILRARRLMERLSNRLPTLAAPRWVKVWSLLIALAQVFLPALGLLLIIVAVQSTGLVGPLGTTAINALGAVGILGVAGNWLGRRFFPKEGSGSSPLRLGARDRVEGRVLTPALALLVGLELLRDAMVGVSRAGEVAASVLSFPVLLVAGILLLRMGRLLQRHAANEIAADLPLTFQSRVIGLLGRAARVVGVVGPLLAAIGYVPAAVALVYPAVTTLALLALLYVLQRLVDEIYDLLSGRAADESDALVPVLIGFLLSIAAMPLLALVWGARIEDLAELWTGFRQGFAIGETRIAPADFLVFAVIFALGWMITRLLQTALRATVLPRTRLDLGGQNAILAGIGYVGIFLSGLIAINSAGINLAGLAIVAGALSLGIGFGLQNIVQNFVSGIILLVERPVSEGDWIEVAGVQGTVQAISVRSTRIQTFDRTDVIVPNADLVSGKVTNWTRFNLTGRLIVPVSVAYSSDSRKVARVLLEIAEAEPLAVMNPGPAVFFMGFGPECLNFEIRMILRDVNFSLQVMSEINHEIVRRFREEGIETPATQREVWVRSAEPALDAAPQARGRPRAVAPPGPEGKT